MPTKTATTIELTKSYLERLDRALGLNDQAGVNRLLINISEQLKPLTAGDGEQETTLVPPGTPGRELYAQATANGLSGQDLGVISGEIVDLDQDYREALTSISETITETRDTSEISTQLPKIRDQITRLRQLSERQEQISGQIETVRTQIAKEAEARAEEGSKNDDDGQATASTSTGELLLRRLNRNKEPQNYISVYDDETGFLNTEASVKQIASRKERAQARREWREAKRNGDESRQDELERIFNPQAWEAKRISKEIVRDGVSDQELESAYRKLVGLQKLGLITAAQRQQVEKEYRQEWRKSGPLNSLKTGSIAGIKNSPRFALKLAIKSGELTDRLGEYSATRGGVIGRVGKGYRVGKRKKNKAIGAIGSAVSMIAQVAQERIGQVVEGARAVVETTGNFGRRQMIRVQESAPGRALRATGSGVNSLRQASARNLKALTDVRAVRLAQRGVVGVGSGVATTAGVSRAAGRFLGAAGGGAIKAGGGLAVAGGAIGLAAGGPAAAGLALVGGATGVAIGAATGITQDLLNSTNLQFKSGLVYRFADRFLGEGATKALENFRINNASSLSTHQANGLELDGALERAQTGKLFTRLNTTLKAIDSFSTGAGVGAIAGSLVLGPAGAIIGAAAGGGLGFGAQFAGSAISNRFSKFALQGVNANALRALPLGQIDAVVQGNLFVGTQTRIIANRLGLLPNSPNTDVNSLEKTLYGGGNLFSVGLNLFNLASLTTGNFLLYKGLFGGGYQAIGSVIRNRLGALAQSIINTTGVGSRFLQGLSRLNIGVQGAGSVSAAGLRAVAAAAGAGAIIGSATGALVALASGAPVGFFAAVGGAAGGVAGAAVATAVIPIPIVSQLIGSAIGSSLGTFLGSQLDRLLNGFNLGGLGVNPITVAFGLINFIKIFTGRLRSVADYGNIAVYSLSFLSFIAALGEIFPSGTTFDQDNCNANSGECAAVSVLPQESRLALRSDDFQLVDSRAELMLNPETTGDYQFFGVDKAELLATGDLALRSGEKILIVTNPGKYLYDPEIGVVSGRAQGAEAVAFLKNPSSQINQGQLPLASASAGANVTADQADDDITTRDISRSDITRVDFCELSDYFCGLPSE